VKAALLALFLSLPIQAEGLTAIPFRQVLSTAVEESYSFRGRGLLFGYFSTESCLWVSKTVLLVEHYCHPKRNYPARAITLWSRKFGQVYLYEEKLSQLNKHDITLGQFPGYLQAYFPRDLRNLSISDLNGIMEKLYQARNPACWSTNYDRYSGQPGQNCFGTEIQRFPAWAADAGWLVGNPEEWNASFRALLQLTDR
jgi:hypothetical protein